MSRLWSKEMKWLIEKLREHRAIAAAAAAIAGAVADVAHGEPVLGALVALLGVLGLPL